MIQPFETRKLQRISDDADDLKLLANSVEAQTNLGGFYFIDEGRLFVGGEPSADFKLIIEDLRARGVDVVIITSDNPNNLTIEEITDQKTAELGLGSDSNDTLNGRVIVCTFNKHVQNEFESKEAQCFTGDGFEGLISLADTQHAQELIREGYINGDPDAGFLGAYQYFEKIFDERDARATQQAVPQTESTAIPYQEQANNESVVGVPPKPSFYETNKTPITYSTIGTALIGILVGYNVLTKPKRMFVQGVENSRRSALDKFKSLEKVVGEGLTSFDAVDSYLSAPYPDEAEDARNEKAAFDKEWNALVKAQAALIAAKVGLIHDRAKMSDVEIAAKEVGEISQRLHAQVEAIIKKRNELYEKKEAAQTNTDIAKKKLEETIKWYKEKQQIFPNALPSEDVAFAQIQGLCDEAEHNSYLNTALALRGSEDALRVSGMLEKFEIAVDTLIQSYDFSVETFRSITSDLDNWPELAVNPEQLISSGRTLLGEAKSMISDPEKLEQVVVVSKAASEQIRFAKDFSSAEATILALQDENNQSIKKINEEVKKITDEVYKDSLIQDLRDEAAEALSSANLAASKGKWSEAQAQLGILRVKTNETLAEMNRLDQLRKNNDKDLKSIAKEVSETRKTYQSETTEAWNDLSQNFKSENYDESTEPWKILRKDMSKKEVVNFSDHFTLIDKILTEITDNPADPKDIASVATLKNSMDKQEFDKSSALIRDMEKRLAHAQQLMDGILERQKLARKSEKEYLQAIANSEARLKEALTTVDTQEERRMVEQSPEDMIKEAGQLIKFAENAGKAFVYVAALEAATKATNLAIQGKKLAEGQIDALRDLYDDLGSHKKESLAKVSAIIAKVEEENDEVITSASSQVLKALQSAISGAANDEKSLAALEDRSLAEAIKTLLVTYTSIDALRESLKDKFEADKESYQELLDQLETAISNASSAINSASSRCSHQDAGYSGNTSLASARATLPSKGKFGDKRSSLQNDIKSAKSAQEYAEDAEKKADSAIRAAKAARDREAAEKRAAELAKQQREAAAKRATEQARQRETATRIVTTSNKGKSTKF
ncbi:hypothetical protein KA111_01415 [Candidatus Woesebacteria bacterium]|nr:hypothetical protein [Candidatus Woesebacteria bacterium]